MTCVWYSKCYQWGRCLHPKHPWISANFAIIFLMEVIQSGLTNWCFSLLPLLHYRPCFFTLPFFFVCLFSGHAGRGVSKETLIRHPDQRCSRAAPHLGSHDVWSTGYFHSECRNVITDQALLQQWLFLLPSLVSY